MEQETREPEERSWISQKLVRGLVIGASIVGLGAWLFGRRPNRQLSHVIPPIIIKSVDEDTEPIEVESTTTLTESGSLTEAEALLPAQKLYTLSGFGVTEFVRVRRKNTTTGASAPAEEYRNKAGLTVKLWLQHKTGSSWHDEPHGPHLGVVGTTSNFLLTCERLSKDKPNGNPVRRRKRSYNKNKNWRIGAVQVDNGPLLSTTGYDEVSVEFDNHFH